MADAPFIALGLNHMTAPVEVRERAAVETSRLERTLRRLADERLCDEAFLLSTCNRVELYAVPGPRARPNSSFFFDELRGPRGERFEPYLYRHQGHDAVHHLFRVASSLDSMIVGEPQILGQVKDAIRIAQDAGTLGRYLFPLTQRTLSVAKRIRSQTDIGRSRVGIGNAGVDLAIQIFGSLSACRGLLIGAGEMGRQVSRALVGGGLDELLVSNRTFERSRELANENGGTAIAFERLEEYLSRVDIVLAATGAQKPIITQSMVKKALRRRKYRPLFLVDLSVPRNIDPTVDNLDEAYLFNIDDLRSVVDRGQRRRAKASEAARALVESEVQRFVRSLDELDLNEGIGRMNRRLEEIRLQEMSRSRRLVESLDETQREALEALTRSIVRKALHRPIQTVRESARTGDADTVRTLLALWDEEET